VQAQQAQVKPNKHKASPTKFDPYFFLGFETAQSSLLWLPKATSGHDTFSSVMKTASPISTKQTWQTGSKPNKLKGSLSSTKQAQQCTLASRKQA